MDAISELKEDWKRVDRALIPAELLCSMPQPECKGLTMLTDIMINATVCKLGPCVGQITAPYSEDIEIVLDVAETIERRMEGVQKHRRNDRHLETWVRSLETGAQTEVCIMATGHQYAPAIDDCVSFVLWAETGFFEPPRTLDDATLCVRDPDLYERRQAERSLTQTIEWKAKLLRSEAMREKSLAYCKAQLNLELERQRVRELGWRELIAEHESCGPPTDAISGALYDLRSHLLSLPAPGHPIGQH